MSLLEYDISATFTEKTGLTYEALRALVPELTRLVQGMKSDWKSGGLGFLSLPELDTGPVVELAARSRQRFDRLVVLGIGGSSLGPRAILDVLTPRRPQMSEGQVTHPRVWFNENVDPDDFQEMLSAIDWDRTQFNVISKSGSTIETLSGYFIVLEELVKRFGEESAREHIVVTTDPMQGPLRELVNQIGYPSLEVPPGVGGRYSVLSAVGLYPCAFGGVDLDALLAGATRARDRCLDAMPLENPAALFAALQVLHYRAGRPMVVFMPYATALASLAEWFCQLWAESLGKTRGSLTVGPTPIKAVGVTDQHSQLQLYMDGPKDKNIVLVELDRFRHSVNVPMSNMSMPAFSHLMGKDLADILGAELRGTQQALVEAGCPTSNLRLAGPFAGSLGAVMMMLEMATALAGGLLGIDPFDQPGVELGKRYAHGLLGRTRDADLATALAQAVAHREKRTVSL